MGRLTPTNQLRRSVIIAELWRPGRKTLNFCEKFLRFWKIDPLWQHFQISVPKIFTASPIDVVLKFREIWPTGNRRNRASALFT